MAYANRHYLLHHNISLKRQLSICSYFLNVISAQRKHICQDCKQFQLSGGLMPIVSLKFLKFFGLISSERKCYVKCREKKCFSWNRKEYNKVGVAARTNHSRKWVSRNATENFILPRALQSSFVVARLKLGNRQATCLHGGESPETGHYNLR